MSRIVDTALLVLALVGAFFAWQAGRERTRLEGTYHRLARLTGGLAGAEVRHPTVLPLEGDDARDVRYFVRLPAPGRVEVGRKYRGRSSVRVWGLGPETTVGVRLGENSRGGLELAVRLDDGTNFYRFEPEVAAFLRGRLDRLRVERLPAGVATTLDDPAHPTVLLRLTAPDDLVAEAREVLPATLHARYFPVLYELTFRPVPPPPPEEP
jgi:hypothetical protein